MLTFIGKSPNVILSAAKDLGSLTTRVPKPEILRCAQDDIGGKVCNSRRWNLDKRITVGAIIVYRLRPEQLPTNPDRLWTGLVIKVYKDRENIESGVLVEVVDSGYEGCTEVVITKQIVRVIDEQ